MDILLTKILKQYVEDGFKSITVALGFSVTHESAMMLSPQRVISQPSVSLFHICTVYFEVLEEFQLITMLCKLLMINSGLPSGAVQLMRHKKRRPKRGKNKKCILLESVTQIVSIFIELYFIDMLYILLIEIYQCSITNVVLFVATCCLFCCR